MTRQEEQDIYDCLERVRRFYVRRRQLVPYLNGWANVRRSRLILGRWAKR